MKKAAALLFTIALTNCWSAETRINFIIDTLQYNFGLLPPNQQTSVYINASETSLHQAIMDTKTVPTGALLAGTHQFVNGFSTASVDFDLGFIADYLVNGRDDYIQVILYTPGQPNSTIVSEQLESFCTGLSPDLNLQTVVGSHYKINEVRTGMFPPITNPSGTPTEQIYKIDLEFVVTSIPEPASFGALAGAACVAYGLLRRRRK